METAVLRSELTVRGRKVCLHLVHKMHSPDKTRIFRILIWFCNVCPLYAMH